LLLVLTSARLAAQQESRPRLAGIRFAFDTVESPARWRGALTRVAGLVEFAAGRGRLSVLAVRLGPAVAVNGVQIGRPLAQPGDYYLFDTTEFILVRPRSRTFSRFVLTRADYNHTGHLLPGAFLMRYTPCSTDTLGGAGERVTQHAPISVHWHLDSLDERGPMRIYARGWLEIRDAPAVEAGVARWFGVAIALAARPAGVAPLTGTKLQLTAVSLLRTRDVREPYLRYSAILTPIGLVAVDVDPTHLMLPRGYTETRWPGSEQRDGMGSPSFSSAARWRVPPTARSP
jgi:hypothetical protein